LAKEGAKVAITDINADEGQLFAKNLRDQGYRAEFWRMDATSEENVEQVFGEVFKKYGAIHGLVNNVGAIGKNKPTHELSEAEWDRTMNINVKSVFLCTKHVISYLKNAGGGSIVNLSSVHGLLGTPDYPANHASKGAVRLMSKTDAMLYVKDKIRVNSVHPGYILTPLLERTTNSSDVDSTMAQLGPLQPMGHVGEPLDVAYAILYLISDESKFVTASELVVDGGMSGGRVEGILKQISPA
jgi:NAD(P)-dependent dehydrogenase (short-subunit alcohol dehydrogenase family)